MMVKSAQDANHTYKHTTHAQRHKRNVNTLTQVYRSIAFLSSDPLEVKASGSTRARTHAHMHARIHASTLAYQ